MSFEISATQRARNMFKEKPAYIEIPVAWNEVPESAVSQIGARKADVEQILHVKLPTHDTYIFEMAEKEDSKNTFFVDCDKFGKRLGFAILNFDAGNPLFGPSEKPYTEYTATEVESQHGLGTTRLWVMNEYAKRNYGSPMYSGSRLETGARHMWDKLVSDGIAEPVPPEILKSIFRIKSTIG